MSIFLTFVILAFAVSALSLTITRSTLTEPLRDWSETRLPLLQKLLGCPYCISHWLSFAVACVWLPAVTGTVAVDFIITAFALVGMASVVSGVLFHTMLYPEAEVEKLRDKLIQLRDAM